MVFGDVQERGTVAVQTFRGLQLETRQFKYPKIRQCSGQTMFFQLAQGIRADIAGRNHRPSGLCNDGR